MSAGRGRNASRYRPAGLGLIEVRAGVWQDVVFVNLDGAAPDFAALHAALIDRWAEFEQPLHS
jgi:choline monooxygenase